MYKLIEVIYNSYLKYYINLLLVIFEINYQLHYWDAVERNKFSLLHLYQFNKELNEKK